MINVIRPASTAPLWCIVFLLAAGMHVQGQWLKATLPPPYSTGYYLDVFFLSSDPRYGWACSIEGYVVRTTDGGNTWRGTSTSRDFLEYIQFLTPLVGYTSGPAGLYKSVDGGATWTDITPADPNGEQAWGSYFLNEREGVFLVGGCGTSIQSFFRTTNGGATFTLTQRTEPRSGLSDAILYKDGSGFAVSSGVIWRTTDFGASWQKYSSTGPKLWHEELAIVGRTFMIPSAGQGCDGQGAGGEVLVSHDAGFTWSRFNTGENMFGTHLIDENRGWAAGDNRSAFYTSDGGKTWVNRNCGLQGDMDDVFFIGDTLGWIAGAGLYKYYPRTDVPEVQIYPQGPIIEICEGDSVLLTGSIGYTRYLWSDGVSAQARFAKAEGRYTLLAYDSITCHESVAQITVRYFPGTRPRISATVLEVCEGDSVRLDLVADAVTRKWSTGDTTESIYVKSSGVFSATIVDGYGCTRSTQPVQVVVHPLPSPQISTNRKTTICKDEWITLSAPPGYRSYEWSNGSSESNITVNQAGEYTVTVVDQFGCVGTSAAVVVVVLNTQNKVDVLSSIPTGVFVLPDATVGEIACREITILNRSADEDLVIRDPTFVGNVYCSIPQAQLPIVIAPSSVGKLNICYSAVDTGFVHDTLIITDTCSPTYVPVQGYGTSLQFVGNSRCEVPVDVVMIRAGVSHYLYPPYPLPANDRLQLQIAPPLPEASAYLVDALGATRAHGVPIHGHERTTFQFDVSALPRGTYVVVVESSGSTPRGYPVFVVH